MFFSRTSKILLSFLVVRNAFNLNKIFYKPNPLSIRLYMSGISEEDAAARAASTDPAINPAAPTFFDKIVSKEIPANVIYEDDLW
jgi:hypothetical protein